MRNLLKVAITVAILFLAVFFAYGLVITAPVPKQVEAEEVARAIRVMVAEKEQLLLKVRSQGTVSPRAQTELIPEVSGRVQWVSPDLVAGGFVHRDDVLLRIEDSDYQATVERGKAGVTRAKAEDEHARYELSRLKELVRKKLASQSKLETQLRLQKIASATLRDTEIALEQAERDLERTQIRAPYDGFVRNERVDTGQFIARGQSIATLYASDAVEVRLPIADNQLAYLNLPLGVRGELPDDIAPRVTLSTDYGGQHYEWEGKLVRTEAEIDSRSRMLYAIARVINEPDNEHPALPVGLFVQASIDGRQVNDVVSLPRTALRNVSQVLVVDAEYRLRYRDVELLRFDQDRVIISGGLEEGEMINISPIQTVIDGMIVKPVMDETEKQDNN
ncbi:MAG: efflux RND transporter periplasmic adaptor subunit [Gammaproteobacteria bacterium]|nr:efflux RND transporter periplasmic adaptor subunit [Gammaproteobacteria bacterium]